MKKLPKVLIAVFGLSLFAACNTAPPAPSPTSSPPLSSPPASPPLVSGNTKPIAQTAKPKPAAPIAQAPATTPSPAAAAPPPPAPPIAGLPPVMPYDEAVLFAANNLFGKSELPQRAMAAGDKYPLVIDPLIDGNTQAQSNATRDMEARIAQLVQTGYPNFALQPFSTAALARGPILFIGTMTAVDRDGKNVGEASWYRVCLALVDMRTGRIISKGFARAQPQGVDHTPTAFFRDSPATAPDPAVSGYVRTCQGTKVGDLINPDYWDRILAAAMIKDAIAAYEAGRYQEALDIYRGVARIGGGDQLRVYNGIYLAAWKLGQRDAAARAFGDLVDYGFAQNRLGVKFLFRPGTTVFVGDQQLGTQYTMWLQQIASRSVQRPNCMQIAGHTSRTGPEPMNERLSLLRAQFVQQRLTGQAQPLSKRTTTIGRGSADAISGLGTDDLRDAVDRRVEFRVATCT